MTKTLNLTCLIGALFLSACNSAQSTLSDADKTDIDCLASITVMNIAEAVRSGLDNGKQAEDLQSLRGDLTQEGLTRLRQKHDSQAHADYFQDQTDKRLQAMQNALSNRQTQSPDHELMDETRQLAENCDIAQT